MLPTWLTKPQVHTPGTNPPDGQPAPHQLDLPTRHCVLGTLPRVAGPYLSNWGHTLPTRILPGRCRPCEAEESDGKDGEAQKESNEVCLPGGCVKNNGSSSSSCGGSFPCHFQMALRTDSQVHCPQKEGLRRRLSRFFSKSEGNLTRQDNGEADPLDRCGKRKKRSQERKISRRIKVEEAESSAGVTQSTESPKLRTIQKLASKAHGLSLSETDLWRNGLLRKFGSLTWRKRRSSHLEFPEHSGNPANSPWPLGRLHRPAVGSDLDMRGWSAAEEERCELSSHPCKIDSVPSASFDSLLCWGDGNSSWDSASITNSSLCGPASSKMKDDASEVLLEQEKTSSTPESLSGWAESVFEGHLNSQASCPTGIGELDNLSFKSDLGESISRHISGAEGSRTAAESLHGKWPLQGGDATSAFKPSQAKTALKILYEIMITLTKEEENGIVAAAPLTHCSERGRECHSSREGTLSLGVAELEKTEGQRHRQEPARPAPQLSMLEEFQNCIELHGVETFKARRQVLSPATGSQVTPQWGSELSPGECKDQSVTDHLHSGDGELAEGTGTVAPVSWADSFAESHQAPPATNSEEVPPNRLCSIRGDWSSRQHGMEKVTGGSCSFQTRAGGSTSNSSFSWKKGASDLPREEVKSPVGKVSVMAQMIEKGAPRASSPSRISVLLEAWEKGLVGTEPAAQPSSAATRRSRSPVHTRHHLSSKDVSRSLSPANTKSSFSLVDAKRSLSPADMRQLSSHADTKRSFSPAGPKQGHSLAERRQSPSPADPNQSFSSAKSKQSHSPPDTKTCPSLADTKRFFSLGDTKQSLPPADTRQSPSPPDAKRFVSLADAKRCLSPTDTRRSPSLGDTKRSFSPADTREFYSPADRKQSPSIAEMRRSLSPADTRRSRSPAANGQSRSAADARQSSSLYGAKQLRFGAETRQSFPPAVPRRSDSPTETRKSCFVPYTRSSSLSASSQRSSPSVNKQCSSSPSDLQSSSLPDIRQAISSAGAGHSFSVKDIKQLFCPADSRQPSPPADARSSPPGDLRSFSPPSDGRRSRSLSPCRDFTAHGPVFSQVYSPGSKSKNLEGSEVQDSNSTRSARSQGENHSYNATNGSTTARFPKENHTLKTTESQKDSLSTSVSARVAQFQNENGVPNAPTSSTTNGSPKGSHATRTTILKSQTESYQSSTANGTACRKPSGGPPGTNSVSRFAGSRSVSESQTQWRNSKGGNTVVFRSERQVVVPKGEGGTLYREDQEVIVSSSGSGSKSQHQRGLTSNASDNIAPKENYHQLQDDLTNGKSPKISLTSANGVCNSSLAEPQPQNCMTQPRSTGVNDAQRQRCMLAPSPVTSNRDATACGEGAVHFSTPHSDCSIHNIAVFQKHSSPVAAGKTETLGSMPDSGAPKVRESNQECYLTRGEKVTASGFKISWCTSGVGGTAAESSMSGTLLGSQKTAPEGQKFTTQTERKKEWSDPAKDALVFAQGPIVQLIEADSSHEPLSQETGRSFTPTEEEPEESVDMELFVDTLRNMEAPELRKPMKIHSRSPRPSILPKQAALPPIHEHWVTPKSKVPLPTALDELLALNEERNLEAEKESRKELTGFAEEIEEIENPYLTENEKSQANNPAKKTYPWENKPYKTEEEIGTFLGKLQQASVEYKVLAPKATGNQTSLIRANILKGPSLLCDFVDKKSMENKPYSRLDSSLLYSKFIIPEKSQFKALEKGKDGRSSPLLPVVLKVNRECQTSPNGTQVGTKEHLRSESTLAGFQVHSSSRTPAAKISFSQIPALPQRTEDRVLKINMRPGKIILYSEGGFGGQKREIWGDIIDATDWVLSHTISVRVIRGGWVMYEKPRFLGRKCVLAEGDVEITNPWKMYHKEGEVVENTLFHIGSLKRVVRDYRIAEISLFMEENGEGPKQKFVDSSEDMRTHGQPFKAASIIVHSGLWLVYSKPFFDDDPYVLEPGGYPTLQAWGAKDPSVCSMHPIKLGCPVVEKPGEPRAMIYEMPHFQGHCREVSRDIYDLKKLENSEDYQMVTVGSLKIVGGCWVGYEKEGFRGHQYLLEEGEYLDWSQWGGYSKHLVSLRLIRTDFLDPVLTLFEAMDFEDGPSIELNEALPDVELAGYGTTTQSLHVLSGVWVAYEDKNFSGEQYILEKGVYRNCEDWGASSCRISSVQPILQVGEHSLHFVSVIQLFSGPDFSGAQMSFKEDQPSLPDLFIPRSCRVHRGSWILYDSHHFEGEQHVISEGEYPTLTSMGCLTATAICSLKKVPLFFSEPSIFLHGLECFEGKEIELNSEVRSLQAEGFNNHVLSVQVKGGIWVLCEHSDFRGRQWMLDCTEITNWLTYSGLQHIGSLYPIRQRRVYFRMKNGELKSFLSVPDDVEDMKAGRVLVSELNDRNSSIWYYEEGLLKNQIAPGMSLQVIGPAKMGAKVVLWSETRTPKQTWLIDSFGRIYSQMFENMIVDVKGGDAYDQHHAILWDSFDERPTQIWDIQVL